ncbi:hypothetical protein Vretimale_18017 [Volvox reticuliferus]|uniref:Uncharacterized protein n=1 Tax=Volvox reticuliferus TaxID=1737510 RepID=A0A8J4LZ19_9CHLO|nr:hypothetical protein Vretimale_18017 [Volvox reticuliferus]
MQALFCRPAGPRGPALLLPEVINGKGLYDLPEGLQLNLEHLDLQGVPFTQDAVIEGPHPGNDLARALQRLTVNRLVSLRLGWLGEASDTDIVRSNLDDVMDQVRASAGTLRLLDLAGFWSGNSFGSAGERCLHSLSALRVLCLSNCREPDLGIGLQRCPTTQLVYLNLRGLSALEDANLAPLLAANPGLRSLNVGCCALLSDATLQAVARHCRGLTSLDVCYARGMTAQGVRAVLKYLPLLNEFGCSGFVGLMDVDISNLVTRLPGLRMIGGWVGAVRELPYRLFGGSGLEQHD